jgi:hypothetical protein
VRAKSDVPDLSSALQLLDDIVASALSRAPDVFECMFAIDSVECEQVKVLTIQQLKAPEHNIYSMVSRSQRTRGLCRPLNCRVFACGFTFVCRIYVSRGYFFNARLRTVTTRNEGVICDVPKLKLT